jgi:hypothetical protein
MNGMIESAVHYLLEIVRILNRHMFPREAMMAHFIALKLRPVFVYLLFPASPPVDARCWGNAVHENVETRSRHVRCRPTPRQYVQERTELRETEKGGRREGGMLCW